MDDAQFKTIYKKMVQNPRSVSVVDLREISDSATHGFRCSPQLARDLRAI